MEPRAAAGPCGLLWGALRELPLGEAFHFEPGAPLHEAAWGLRGGCQEASGSGARAWPSPAGELCHRCRLPLGSYCYTHGLQGQLLHGECKAELVLEQAKADEETRLQRDVKLKERHRVEFGIGWRPEMIPGTEEAARMLGCPEARQGMYCVVLAEDSHSVRLAPTADPAAAINPEYLSTALRVRREHGREASFSLDPQQGPQSASDGRDVRWQSKRFEPPWLDGTSAGEVLFQADYHLKELSMGECDQPVLGMKSCLDLAGPEASRESWHAREWFVVRRAVLQHAEDGALVPRVDMGVEAREMARGHGGALEDARITRPDHPLVRYAADFTRHFDLIAERRSVVYQLRELARASVVAKFMLESVLDLEESWFCLGDPRSVARTPATIPQLWNERSHSRICVKDGEILDAGMLSGTSVHGVYGGVQLSLQEIGVSKKTLQPLNIPSWFPKGVDLNLDAHDLSAPTGTRSEGTRSNLPCGDTFWSRIDCSAEPQPHEEHKRFLCELFNPHLADRRGEGDKFTPPDSSPAYAHKLRESLQAEEEVRQRRQSCFFDASFDVEHPGPLFPSSWKPPLSFGVLPEGDPVPPAARGLLCPRPELEAEALCLLWQSPVPVFDRIAEDGARFRVYRAQGLELRTLQPHGGAERLGTVLSVLPSAPAARSQHSQAPQSPQSSESGGSLAGELLGALELVEAAPAAGGSGGARFYVVLEAGWGRAVAEEGADGRLSWALDPEGLEARNAAAKVLRSLRCEGAGICLPEVQSLTSTLPTHAGSRACAEGVFGYLLARHARALDSTREMEREGGMEREPCDRAFAPPSCADASDYSDLNYAI